MAVDLNKKQVLTTHSRLIIAFPVIASCLRLAACLLCFTIAAIMLKATPESNKKWTCQMLLHKVNAVMLPVVLKVGPNVLMRKIL